MDMRQLVRAFDAGRIDADTLVWRKGMPDWRRLRDIPELADRLVGNGSTATGSSTPGDGSERRGSEPPAEFAQPGTGAPAPQAERSRTPPASYTVGARSGSDPPGPAHGSVPPPAADGALNDPNAGHSSASSSSIPPAPEGAVATERGSGAPAADGGTPAPSRRSTPSGAPRAASSRRRSKIPSRPNASPTPVPSRTVTQTGLESPAAVTARNSVPPPAGVALADGAPARTRDSRTSEARASVVPGGSRRPSSSDETPAQKPSSLSVPPGALVSSPTKPQSRRFLALAAVVLGGAILLLKQVATSGDGEPITAEHRVDAVLEHERAGNAAERKAVAQPDSRSEELSDPAAAARPELGAAASARSSSSAPSSSSSAPSSSSSAPSGAAPATAAAPSSAATRSAAGATASPATASGSTAVTPGPASSKAPLNVEASARETVGAPATTAPAAPVPGAPQSPALAAAAPAPVREAPSPPPVAKSEPAPVSAPAAKPAAPPAAKSEPAPAKPPLAEGPEPAPVVSRAPRPFDEVLATQQFQSAVTKAAECAQQGSTRGVGRVKVAIEPWGRVGRVTHLTQDFVGTPVGLCVMQAFQEIRVPPFDGNSRSIAGDFVVE